MKKCLSVLMAAVMMLSALVFCAEAKSGIRIDSDYAIVVEDPKNPYQTAAAQKLQMALREIGLSLPIVGEAEKSITICTSGNKSIYANGYRIHAGGNTVFIDGRPARGLICGVYRFLEEFAGLRVYTSKLRLLDKADALFVPEETNIYYRPYFEYTETDFVSPRDPEYSLANGLTGGVYRQIPADLGGTVNYVGSFAHTLTTQFCAADTYFESHPEYFALHGGVRTSRQLCLSNPDVVKLVTDEVLDALRRNHDPAASLQIVSLTQNDNLDYCECEACAAFEQAHGSAHSACILRFVNQVADAVKAAGYANVAIDTFAYQYSRQAPAGIVPRENVIVRLCTIEGCFTHPFDDPDCEKNAAIMKDLNDWSKICDRIYIWDYANNYRNTLSVWPNFNVIQRNLQVFYAHNVKGVYVEGNFYMQMSDAEFGELKSYMISRCLQDPYCDLEKAVDGFLAAYYGDGWESVKAFIQLASEKGGRADSHMSIYEDAQDCLQFSRQDIKAADAMWETALSRAKDETQAEHVKRSMLSYRYYKGCARKGEFSPLNPYCFAETEKLYNDMIGAGITCDQELRFHGEMLNDPFARYVRPNKWGKTSPGSARGIAIITYAVVLKLIEMVTGVRPTLWA